MSFLNSQQTDFPTFQNLIYCYEVFLCRQNDLFICASSAQLIFQNTSRYLNVILSSTSQGSSIKKFTNLDPLWTFCFPHSLYLSHKSHASRAITYLVTWFSPSSCFFVSIPFLFIIKLNFCQKESLQKLRVIILTSLYPKFRNKSAKFHSCDECWWAPSARMETPVTTGQLTVSTELISAPSNLLLAHSPHKIGYKIHHRF
jgi:hypothetical protein